MYPAIPLKIISFVPYWIKASSIIKPHNSNINSILLLSQFFRTNIVIVSIAWPNKFCIKESGDPSVNGLLVSGEIWTLCDRRQRNNDFINEDNETITESVGANKWGIIVRAAEIKVISELKLDS